MNSSNSFTQTTATSKVSPIFEPERPSLSLVQTKNENKLDRSILEQNKAIAQIYVEQASIYLKQCDWHKAIVACKNSLDLLPDNASAYKILGDVLYRQGRQGDALGIYARALAIDPNIATIYANVGTIYADSGKWREALDYYQQAVILDPNLAGTYRNLARVWEELGDTDKALECLCRAINLEPTILEPEEYFSFGRELYQQGKVKEASILFINGVKLAPQAEAELSQLVEMLEELEEWQQAVVYYHKLISLPDSNVGTAASIASNSPTSDLAGKPIRKLLSNSKNESQSKQEQISPKITAKNTQTEIPLLSQNVARKLLPNIDSTADRSSEKSVLARNAEHPKDLDPSKSNRSIVSLDPNTAVSWNNLGSLYAQEQEWRKAISCYQESLKLEPNFTKSYRNLARVYQNLGEESKAALCWYEAFALEPDLVKPEEYFSLANKLVQHQQIEKAIACLRRTVELKPDFSKARVALGKLIENQ